VTSAGSLPDLLPARMVNEYVYCPRLSYLEWVQGEWDDNADTVEGRFAHRRVDVEAATPVPEPEADEEAPLYFAESRNRVRISFGTALEALTNEALAGLRSLAESGLMELSQMVLFGYTQISTQAIRELRERGIPVVYLSRGGWFYGMTTERSRKRQAPIRTFPHSLKCGPIEAS